MGEGMKVISRLPENAFRDRISSVKINKKNCNFRGDEMKGKSEAISYAFLEMITSFGYLKILKK
jgi:hypothetical protein